MADNDGIPKFGETRCYWMLLNGNLQCIYCDPVLQAHMQEEAERITGTYILDYIHPDEQVSARIDLKQVLENKAMHGSVTRVRFSRLSHIRRVLGCPEPESFAHADLIVVDDQYLACDVAINWVADGIVLCFVHAIVDLTPKDNDEYHKTQWTNWCQTPRMNSNDSALMYQRLYAFSPQLAPGPPTRIFQILYDQPSRPVVLSWPISGYSPQDYGRLALDVQMGPNESQDARTSCTRRFKALQTLTDEHGFKEIESVFVPHGSIIFACHRVISSYPHPPAPPPQPPVTALPYNTSSFDHLSASSHHQQQNGASSTMSYNPSVAQYMSQFMQPDLYPPAPPQSQHSSIWSTSNNFGTSNSLPLPHLQQSYPPPANLPWPHQHQHQLPPPSIPQHQTYPNAALPFFLDQNPLTQVHGHNHSHSHSHSEPKNTTPPRLAPAPAPKNKMYQEIPRSLELKEPSIIGGGSTIGGHPPGNVSRCADCGTSNSPEWRKGPSGKKDLCNACGLRFSRSKQKQEGYVTQRRRKDKERAAESGKIIKKKAAAINSTAAAVKSQQQRKTRARSPIGAEDSESPSPPPHAAQHHQHQQHMTTIGLDALASYAASIRGGGGGGGETSSYLPPTPKSSGEGSSHSPGVEEAALVGVGGRL